MTGAGDVIKNHNYDSGMSQAAGDISQSKQSVGSQSNIQANTSVQAAAALAKDQIIPNSRVGVSEKEKKLQFVQYECVKSELKEEYDKRVGFLHKRLNKKAQMDPSFMLLNNMTTQPLSAKNSRANTDQLF